MITSLEGANGGLLANWNPKTSKVDITMAKDGSENYTIIVDAMHSLAITKCDWTRRLIMYVKADIYKEIFVVTVQMTNLMVVGNGINKKMAMSNLNKDDGTNIRHSATFGNLI